MNKPSDLPIKADDADEIGYNNSPNESFNNVLQARLSRRGMLRAGMASAATALFGSLGLSACGGSNGNGNGNSVVARPDIQRPNPQDSLLGFDAVAKSLADTVVVPAGYTASVIYALGDPLRSATPAYRNDGSDTDFDHRAGDHHDGIEYFGLSASGAPDPASSSRGLLAMNHEATSHGRGEWPSPYLHVDGGTLGTTTPRPLSEIDKEVAAHGVSVVEVVRGNNGSFSYVVDSNFNRRVTPLTPVELSGQAAGSELLVTRYSQYAGVNKARGTINNCGTGRTPWGTLLTGEENFNGYFRRANTYDSDPAEKSIVALGRYGRGQNASSRHGWETGSLTDDRYTRWDLTPSGSSAAEDFRNELNTFGYMVEIDPYNDKSPIKKRTSLGRFAHESGAFGKLVANQPLAVYMGDDSRGEYMFKYVSNATWNPSDASDRNRMSMGDKYLDDGKLYVARFSADGTGTWILLNKEAIPSSYTRYAFVDDADVLINARLAADAVGATPMDRPEWCAVHPTTGEIYYTLTNNSSRRFGSATMPPDAANPRDYSDAHADKNAPQTGNVHGHIIRIRENNSESAATGFTWDVYLFGAEAGSPSHVNLSSLTDDQDFSAPDGLVFSQSTGICWIQTDDGAYTDVTNCMMLAALPGQVGDGEPQVVENPGGSVTTHMGKKPTSDTLKRFLVGPVDSEITGICETPDGRAIFVNIQHPGETISVATVGNPSNYVSHWPANAGYGAGGATTARPRSATIVITKDDGGRIGT